MLAYVKNQGLSFEVPYLMGANHRRYLPDFLLEIDDGHGPDDPLHLVAEIKGYRGEDAKEKANTMRSFWIPGVNNLGQFGRWAFAEFIQPYSMDEDLEAVIAKMIDKAIPSRTI